MLLAALRNVEKFYGEQTVLEDANLELRDNTRTALIGRNGAGKSTILNLLTKLVEPDRGEIYLRDGVSVAKLEQDPNFANHLSVEQISEQAFDELDKLEKRLEILEADLADPKTYEEWEIVHEVFERRGGYKRRSRRDAVLYALGFRGREQQLASSLSGGEKTRLGLAKILMAQPDVLLLDEPTNHLDMNMRAWLEKYLSFYPGAVLIVSHDRELLDRSCSLTSEIAMAKLRSFKGNVSQYRAYRAEQLRLEELTRKNQQAEHERLDTAAKRMKKWAGQNAKLHRRAKAMERRLERFEDTMIADADLEAGKTRFGFDCEPSGEIVMQAKGLTKSFNDKLLFKNTEFTIRKEQRIALVGANGAGKSTFLKMLLGDITSDSPNANIQYGSRVRLGYYDQELKGVNPDNTLIEEMISLVGITQAHNMLGQFMFPYDAQYKKIRDLSGGEKARLALLKLTLGEYNFLVLDEPTNHLDVEMIEALENALMAYTGTLFIVSHDRRFIDKVTNIIWEIDKQELIQYDGDWGYYQFLQNKKQEQEKELGKSQKQIIVEKPKPKNKISKWQAKQDIVQVEASIEALETELEQIQHKLTGADGISPEEIIEASKRYPSLEQELLNAMENWEQLSEIIGDG
ncbi:MAG TPA: ABC transporter ATP-binding protein [Trueperaceae bacterium]|nr:ABC transporter ATP-binding protein [Trueperaceae bacterium]